MLPESAEGRLRQAPPRRVPGMDMHAYGPGQRGADSTCARDHRLSVSPFPGLRAPDTVELS